jgi:hypothetical protein
MLQSKEPFIALDASSFSKTLFLSTPEASESKIIFLFNENSLRQVRKLAFSQTKPKAAILSSEKSMLKRVRKLFEDRIECFNLSGLLKAQSFSNYFITKLASKNVQQFTSL